MAHANSVLKKRMQERFAALQETFARAAIGDFSQDVALYEEEDAFTKVFVGVQIMLEVIRAQVQELRTLNERLEGKIQELESEMVRRETWEARKDDFIAILGHELRNPLAPITYAAQIISMKAAAGDLSAEDLRENAAIIERQSTHIARLISDLLDMSRILRGKLELKIATVELASVIRNAVETTQPLFEEKQHGVNLELPSDELLLEADALRLEQATVNILNNAAKYTPHGGMITVSGTRDDDHAFIRVKDSGIGIPQGFIDKMFNIFTRGSDSSVTGEGGLGIGLTVAKGIAMLHGGDISVASAGHNKGTEITIQLPIYQQSRKAVREKAPEEKPEMPAITPVGTSKRILIVDDNQDNADTLAQMLRQFGQEVRTVYDGLSALQLAPRFKPHIIILDLSMPQMDGFDVLRQLKQDMAAAQTRIVALTGYGQPSDIAKTKAAGFDAHLVKPPNVSDILKLLA